MELVLSTGGHNPPSRAKFGRGVGRMYAACAGCHPFVALILILVTLALAWVLSIDLGGSSSPGPHLFYVPLALAAIRFSWPGAIAAAAAAGTLAGPLLPAEVDTGTGQLPGNWLLRFVILLSIGTFVSLLVGRQDASSRNALRDAVTSARMQRALRRGVIEVFYQPIYEVESRRLAGLEALVRWRKSPDGLVTPDRFIPAAEHTGAITEIDEFVLRQSLSRLRGWTARHRSLWVSVNLSAASLERPDIVQTIEGALTGAGLSPRLLQIEITESALIGDLTVAVEHIQALRALGVVVAIDDFGSGHASLNYLQHLPIDVAKLNQSLVGAATIDGHSRRLLEGVVHLCGLLNVRLIAEGVEFDDELELLRGANVSMAQGFLLGRPATVDQIAHLLEEGGAQL